MSRPKGTGCIYQRPDSSVFWIKYSWNGKTFRESAHTDDKRKAGKKLNRRLAELEMKIFPGLHVERVRVEELAEDFVREYRINGRKSLEDAETRWKLHLKPFFAALRAADVSSREIDKYVDLRQKDGAANATINRELAALKRMFRLGQQATPPKLLRVPAFPNKLKENNARTGFLTDAQRDMLAAKCAEVGLWLRAMYEVGSTYGWRVNEVRGLRVRHIDITARTIRLDPGTTKNGAGRVVTFEQESTLYPLLCACVHGKVADDFVFTREDGKHVRDFRVGWARACCAADVGRMICVRCGTEQCPCSEDERRTKYKGLIFHDLRRTAARNLRRAGVAENLIMQIGGWRTRSVFDRYAIITENDIADAMRKLDADHRQREALAAKVTMGHETVHETTHAPARVAKPERLN